MLLTLKGGFTMVNINSIPMGIAEELAYTKEEISAYTNIFSRISVFSFHSVILPLYSRRTSSLRRESPRP